MALIFYGLYLMIMMKMILTSSLQNWAPNRSKKLINLFCKLKIRVSNSVFETEVFFLYMCIKDTCSVNLLYFDDNEQNCFDI
ncbi:P52 family lipoprotein [Borreliella bavariensis]|uniref:P52 family lipoprotein n=1 Tax=Borreliella bavariensis TaxID=664662 RepID=UPI002D810F41|nr:P52 family lipoprotein [Borreliella bavariensis]